MVKQFLCYLLGRPFLVQTDHVTLMWLLNLRNRKRCWHASFQHCGLTVHFHFSGCKHGKADSLSCREGALHTRCICTDCPECGHSLTFTPPFKAGWQACIIMPQVMTWPHSRSATTINRGLQPVIHKSSQKHQKVDASSGKTWPATRLSAQGHAHDTSGQCQPSAPVPGTQVQW